MVVLLKGGGAPRRADRILVSAWGEGETNADGLDGKGRGWTGFHANEVNTEGRESMIGRTSSKGKDSKKDLPLIQNLLSEFFCMENSSRSVAPRFSFHPKMVPTPEWKPIPNTTPTMELPRDNLWPGNRCRVCHFRLCRWKCLGSIDSRSSPLSVGANREIGMNWTDGH